MTGGWQPPGNLAPEIAYLVRQLRDIKDRSGVSLARLAAETPYSKSSWARYLSGTALPSRQAIRDLARVADEPAPRLLALWERAEANWSGRAAGAPPGGTAPVDPGAPPIGDAATRPPTGGAALPPPTGHRRRRLRTALLAGAVPAVAVMLILPFTLRRGAPAPHQVTPTYPIGCRGASCVGKDAQTMDCGLDANSFAELRIDGTHLELRISDQCAAAWGKVSHAAVGDVVSVVDRDGRAEAISVSDPAMTGRFLSTDMIVADRHSRVRACLDRAGVRRCTHWGGRPSG